MFADPMARLLAVSFTPPGVLDTTIKSTSPRSPVDGFLNISKKFCSVARHPILMILVTFGIASAQRTEVFCRADELALRLDWNREREAYPVVVKYYSALTFL